MKIVSKRVLHFVFLLVVVAFMSGCVSMSTMQTARTTDPGDFVYGSGVGFVSTEMEVEDKTYNLGMPMVEVYTRVGITEKLDAGLSYTIPGTFKLDGKYMVYGDQESTLAASVGGGIGYLNLKQDDFQNRMLDFVIPAYATVYPTSWLALYASPKYIMRSSTKQEIDAPDTKEKSFEHWYGSSIGIRLGKEDWKNNIFMEYNYFGNSVGNPYSQIMLGVGFGMK